ncbi:MAG: DUF1667 domain-containing protein [Oscillospiraceae bacterium]
MTELTCIVCPKGCHLSVDESDSFKVTGNSCFRGEEYGKRELCNPVRTVTSTVRIEGAKIERCPVKTSAPIPKGIVAEAVRLLNGVCLKAPVQVGEAVIENIPNTDAGFVVTRALEKA